MHVSDRLQYLWQQYANDVATQAELEELTALLNNPLYNEAAKAYLLENLHKTLPLQTHGEERLQSILRKIRKEDVADRIFLPYRESMADRKLKRLKRVWYAAAAILIITVAIGFLVNSSKNEKQQEIVVTKNDPVKNDIAPGGNKAILTLADGTSIALDSAAEGALAQQGASNIVKLANGKIAYETKGSSAQVFMNTMSTPRGGQYKLQLPDGTDVWLNAASSITYPSAFVNNERNVSVTGEVYFEVAKDKSKPFHVLVKAATSLQKDMQIEVLGTHFNINAYNDENSIRTTLLEGSVKVALGAENNVLKPGQQSVINSTQDASNPQKKSSNNITVLNNVNLDEVIAWKTGYFQFNRADIKTVMRQISRWYDVDVVYEGAIPKDKFVGDLPMDANASQVLRTLEKVQVHFRIDGKKIIVTP